MGNFCFEKRKKGQKCKMKNKTKKKRKGNGGERLAADVVRQKPYASRSYPFEYFEFFYNFPPFFVTSPSH